MWASLRAAVASKRPTRATYGAELNAAEQLKIREFDCNLNSGPSLFIEDYTRYAGQFS